MYVQNMILYVCAIKVVFVLFRYCYYQIVGYRKFF